MHYTNFDGLYEIQIYFFRGNCWSYLICSLCLLQLLSPAVPFSYILAIDWIRSANMRRDFFQLTCTSVPFYQKHDPSMSCVPIPKPPWVSHSEVDNSRNCRQVLYVRLILPRMHQLPSRSKRINYFIERLSTWISRKTHLMKQYDEVFLTNKEWHLWSESKAYNPTQLWKS